VRLRASAQPALSLHAHELPRFPIGAAAEPASPPVPDSFHRIAAVRIGGKWSAEVFGEGKVGQGFAKGWLDAVNAAMEDLKEKVS
jgi:hypothetical protein